MSSVGSAPAVLTPTHNRARSKATPYLPSYLEAGQLCVVCGDAATGLHYRAITCEGCKGFFRRTAQRRLSYTCKNNEQCSVNRNTRNGCQRCRLLKCYAEGMTTELVLDDAARVQKRELIRENRVRRELERTLDSLRIRPHPIPSLDDTHSLTHAYCVHVDRVPETADLNQLISASARRNKYFAHAIDVFGKLDHSEQAELLECSLLDVQLLRFLSFYDETADCFEVNGRSVSSASLLASLPVGSPLVGSLLVADIFWLAKQFSRLQLCNRQLAVIYAILIFNPDNLPQASSILETADQLHLQLGALCEENDERTAGKMLAHLISHVKQVRILSAALVPHFTPANAAFFTTMMSV